MAIPRYTQLVQELEQTYGVRPRLFIYSISRDGGDGFHDVACQTDGSWRLLLKPSDAPALVPHVGEHLGVPAPNNSNSYGFVFWTPPYVERGVQGLMITASVPAVSGGRFVGVVGVDLAIADLLYSTGLC